jgi:hypothetical protein
MVLPNLLDCPVCSAATTQGQAGQERRIPGGELGVNEGDASGAPPSWSIVTGAAAAERRRKLSIANRTMGAYDVTAGFLLVVVSQKHLSLQHGLCSRICITLDHTCASPSGCNSLLKRFQNHTYLCLSEFLGPQQHYESRTLAANPLSRNEGIIRTSLTMQALWLM